MFCMPAMKLRGPKIKYCPFVPGTGIHFRAMTLLLFLGITLASLQMIYMVRTLLHDRYATSTMLSSTFSQQLSLPGTTQNYFACYHKHVILLSGDVETNPGPSTSGSPPRASPPGFFPGPGPYMNPDTQYIINTMAEYNKQTYDAITQVKHEVVTVHSELTNVKQELRDISSKVARIESRQAAIERTVRGVQSNVDRLAEDNEYLKTEVESLSHYQDRDSSDLHDISKRLHDIESQTENVKNSLRVFGLPDSEDELPEHTKDKYVSEIHKTVLPETPFKDEDIVDIRRVGKYNVSKPRMVIIKFASTIIKSNIFGSRDQLRAKGIRVSNDLTKFQRQKLKELSKRGIIGYYRNGVLYQRDAKQYPTDRTYVHARRRGNQPMEVVGDDLHAHEPDGTSQVD